MTSLAPRVLVLDRDAELAARLRHHVARSGAVVKRCADVPLAERALSTAAWDVVVAGPSFMHRSGLRRLGSLHHRFPWVALVLALHERPRVDLAEIVQAGAVDLVPLHIDDGELRRTLERAARITRRRLNPGSPTRGGRIVMVSSASGGCGKTFLATNAAEFLAQRTHQPVVLFDLDLQFGEVSTALRMRPELTVTDALTAEADGYDLDQILDDYLLAHPDGFKVLAAPRLPAEADSVTPGDITRILDVLRARGAWVVVDTHEGLSDLSLAVVEAVDHVFAVATPDRPSLVNMGRFLSTLERHGVEPGRISVILNKLEAETGFDSVDLTPELGSRLVASVPYSRDVARSLNVGVPLIVGLPKSRISAVLTAGLAHMLPGRPQVKPSAATPLPITETAVPVRSRPPAPEIPATPMDEVAPAGPEPAATGRAAAGQIDLRPWESHPHPTARRTRQVRCRCHRPFDRAGWGPSRERAPPRSTGPPWARESASID